MRERPLASAVIVLHQTPPRFTAAPMGTSIPALRRILGALLDRGYRFVGLRDLGPGGAHPGSIAVTADDGYASQHRHLRPFLRELGVPWTVFVLAGMLGKRNDWDHPWISLRDWHLTPNDVRQLSGQAVDAVAFPWGLSDERVAGAARRAGYRLGFGADVGRATGDETVRAAASSYLIPRLGLYSPDQLFPAFAAAAIGHSHPLRALRSGLERLGQSLVGLAMATQARPRV